MQLPQLDASNLKRATIASRAASNKKSPAAARRKKYLVLVQIKAESKISKDGFSNRQVRSMSMSCVCLTFLV